MDEDGPNDSPYEMLAKHDQSETKRDTNQRSTSSWDIIRELSGPPFNPRSLR
jgi:hypothetical protein